ncbi:MAG: 3'-5' exonuclease [Gemmatimonadetes bacterium]|nr:3'-5' exonuclease [Gemmatimonadota bacterium]
MHVHRSTYHTMAKALRACGDYKVVERFTPRRDWPEHPLAGAERALLVDVETTGMNHERDRIIQLAMVAVDFLPDGTIIRAEPCRTWLEDPGRPPEPVITALTGLRDADLQGQRIDDAEASAIADQASLVIAHNAGFDRPFLEKRLPVFRDRLWACTWRDVAWMDEGFANQKLDWLVQEMCGKFYRAHDATEDTEVLADLLAAKLPVSARSVLSCLIEAARTPVIRLWAERAPFDDRHALKERGYRWSPERRVWYRDVVTDQVDAERRWLNELIGISPRATPLPLHQRFAADPTAG